MTSVLAIGALFFGKYLGWNWLNPALGIVGSILIARWSYGLLNDTSSILLDRNVDPEIIPAVKETIETDSDNRVSDIHVWKVGPSDYSATISIVTHFPRKPDHYKNLLSHYEELSHITVEVNHCEDEPCIKPKDEYQ